MVPENNIDQEKERLESALEAAGVGTWDFDIKNKKLVWSAQCYHLFGIRQPFPVTYADFLAGLHPDDREKTDHCVQQAFAGENGGTFQAEFRTIGQQDGVLRWIRSTGKAYFDAQGTAYRFIGTVADITYQKEAENKLQESEERFRHMADNAPVMIWVTDAEGGCTYLNKNWQHATGQTMEEGSGIGWTTAVHPDDREMAYQHFLAANRAKTGFRMEYRLRYANGTYRWMLDTAMPRFDPKGAFLGYIGSVLDISERKRIEEELELRNALFEAQNEGSPLGILGIDTNKEIYYLNERYAEIFNLSKESIKKITRQELLDIFKKTIRHFDAFLQRIEYLYANPGTRSRDEIELMDGRIIERYGYPIRNREGTYLGWTWQFRDITAQLQAEESLQQKNGELERLIQEFKFVTDFMPQMVWATKPDGFHDFFNKQWFDYTGLSYEQTKADGWAIVLHPDDMERTWQVWSHSLLTGEVYQVEYRMRRHDGVYRWFLARAMPMMDSVGNIKKWFGTCTDIHDQKLMNEVLEQKVQERTFELQEVNRNLERSNSELEQFAYVASHDLQEPLRKIRTFTGMLEAELALPEPKRVSSFIVRIWQSSSRMQELIKDLLDFSRLSRTQQESFTPTNLNEIVHQVTYDLELLINQKEAKISYNDLPVVQASPLQMSQLFYNLLSNALKFAKEGTPLLVEVHCSRAGKNLAAEHGLSLHESPLYHITVKDNGIGFNPEYAEQIFTIFQRLHARSAYEGTGIGLALCKKVVLNHQGAIWATSVPGEGSVFHLLLPEGG
jgi:PAS domain S-box-containing protein